MGLLASALVITGCTSGTTYGTGSSHEAATAKSFTNLFALSSKSEVIDYKSRPELVLPANKNVLPQPAQQQAISTDQNWPVSPEQRIAAIRSDAPTPDWRGSEDLPTEYLNDTNKIGIQNSSKTQQTSRKLAKSGGDEFIQAVRDDANGVGEGVLARERREQISFATGIKRKFLTEPPVEYRTPSADAEAGDLGISETKLSERQKQARKDRKNKEKGVLAPKGANQ